jgi:hypothetical protein
LYDLSVETSVLSAGILLTVDQDYSTFFLFCAIPFETDLHTLALACMQQLSESS